MIEFELKGNWRGAVRSEEEMAFIDKEAADLCFKEQKKNLDKFLQQKGFVKYRTNSYIRRNRIDVLEYINLQKDQYGSKTFTVNFALIALCLPHSELWFDLSNRLGMLICGRDIWWDHADAAVAEVSFQNVMDAIELVLMPWFEERADRSFLKNELWRADEERSGRGLRGKYQEWIETLESSEDHSEVISGNIVSLKLPKKVQ